MIMANQLIQFLFVIILFFEKHLNIDKFESIVIILV